MGKIIFEKKFDLQFFASQMNILLKAGLNLRTALLILAEQMRNSRDKELLEKIVEEIEAGSSLAESLQTKESFPDDFTAVVKAGEESGNLAEVFKNLAEHYQNRIELKKDIKKAGFYPITVILTVITSAVFLMKYILPVFLDLFSDYSGRLPLITRIFIRISYLINSFFIYFIFLILIIILLLYYFSISNKYREQFEEFILKIPLFGRLYRFSILTTIASYLALLLKSGLKLINALTLLEDILSSLKYKNFIHQTAVNISKGGSLRESFSDSSYIPDLFYYLLVTGEEAAQMETMLERAGDYYYQKLNDEADAVLQYLEPLLITVTAIFVALLAAAVMLPLFQIYLII